jgi:hypothetical protein
MVGCMRKGPLAAQSEAVWDPLYARASVAGKTISLGVFALAALASGVPLINQKIRRFDPKVRHRLWHRTCERRQDISRRGDGSTSAHATGGSFGHHKIEAQAQGPGLLPQESALSEIGDQPPAWKGRIDFELADDKDRQPSVPQHHCPREGECSTDTPPDSSESDTEHHTKYCARA